MPEMDQMIQHVAGAIEQQIDLTQVGFHPGKLSLWLRFVRLETDGEHEVLRALKLVEEVRTEKELLYKLAEQVVLAVFGSEVELELPNLIVKLFDRKVTVHLPGAPPLEKTGQIFLKATVYRYEPDLWQQLFGEHK